MASTPKQPWASFIRTEPKKTEPPVRAQPVKRPPDTINPYLPGDPIPKPEAVELDNETTWAEFRDLQATENRRFAETAPASLPMREPEDRGYAPTAPAPLQNLHALPPAPVRRELTVVEVMVEARRNNRVCPMPARWLQLYEMLPDKQRSEPPAPLVDAAWNGTPSIPKRMCFREHIEWAGTHGVLQHVYTFMKSLPESDWHHMGE